MDKKIDFLYKAITDAQELIRFTDTKTAFVITILGVYLITFLTALETIIELALGFSCIFWFFLFLFFIMIIFCIAVTTRIIKPTNNPIKNVKIKDSNIPAIGFYLTPNEYSKSAFFSIENSNSFKLKEDFENYTQNLKKASEDEIINTLALELLKVSYIRNLKNDRFNILIWLLLITTVLFFALFFIYTSETHSMKEHIQLYHKY